MKISDVSMQDGRLCSYVVEFMSKGRWDLSSADSDKLTASKQWLIGLAQEMAKQMKSQSRATVPDVSQPKKVASKKKK